MVDHSRKVTVQVPELTAEAEFSSRQKSKALTFLRSVPLSLSDFWCMVNVSFQIIVYLHHNLIVNILRMFSLYIDFNRNYEHNIIELL